MTNSSAREAFAQLKLDRKGWCWEGEIQYSFWGGAALQTRIDRLEEASEPNDAQMNVLAALVNQTKDIRRPLEKAIFDHYQKHVYGSVSEIGEDDQWEDLTPTLSKPSEIWPLLCEPEVAIGHSETPGGEFRLGFFACQWDEEHGFGVEIRDWKIVSFGGEAG